MFDCGLGNGDWGLGRKWEAGKTCHQFPGSLVYGTHSPGKSLAIAHLLFCTQKGRPLGCPLFICYLKAWIAAKRIPPMSFIWAHTFFIFSFSCRYSMPFTVI